MAPRNEFQAGDFESFNEEDDDPNFELVVVRGDDGIPRIVKSYPGKGSSEDSDQEVDPVEDDPHMWPEATRPTLAELRKSLR